MVSIAKGMTQQFTATGLFSDSSTVNLTEFGDLDFHEHGGGDDHERRLGDGRGRGQHDDPGDLRGRSAVPRA